MRQSYIVLFFLIITVTARIGRCGRGRFRHRASSHSYPVSTGWSGHGSGAARSYPASSGLPKHGSGGAHSYSAFSRLPRLGSGAAHSYPAFSRLPRLGSGGAQSYPVSTGLSGHGSGGGYRNPASTKQRLHSLGHNNYRTKTEVHHHYYYRPPPQIRYGNTLHPVYQRHPPAYVYEYRDSGSRFDNLLTGLALYNLGRNSHDQTLEGQYSSTAGEICKLGISKRSGEYEETRIDCNLMSSFIWEDMTNAAWDEQYVKNTTVNGTGNSPGTVTSSTVEDALKVKGPSIAVTPGMTCYMIRTLGGETVLQKPVDCELLQEYARTSLH